MENFTPAGQLSKTEAIKSLRDLGIATFAYALPELLKIAGAIDFGEYQTLVATLIAGIGFFGNRWLNIARIK